MFIISSALSGLVSIVFLICWVVVLIKMFQSGATGLAIASIFLIICVGIGWLIVFIYGWMKAREWDITNVMIVWTICWVLAFFLGSANFLMIQT